MTQYEDECGFLKLKTTERSNGEPWMVPKFCGQSVFTSKTRMNLIVFGLQKSLDVGKRDVAGQDEGGEAEEEPMIFFYFIKVTKREAWARGAP